MSEKTNRYVNPLTVSGFNQIFGSEQHKELLKELLNVFFNDQEIAAFVIYDDPEAPNLQESLITVKCTTTEGLQLIVVIQKMTEEGFREESRKFISAYFNRIAKSHQNDLEANITACFLLGFLDFKLNRTIRYLHFQDVCSMRMRSKQIFTGMLGFKFLELQNFILSEEELEDDLERWIYTLKHLPYLDEIPPSFKDPLLLQVFDRAGIRI